MSSSAVGVRELKLHAPALIGRAARGERIVISRHGRPQAQLGPIEAAPAEIAQVHGPRMTEWAREKRCFEDLLPTLEAKYKGRYVAIHGKRVAGSDTNPDRLFERLWKKLGGQTFFIGHVGAPPPVVDMPGFEVEH